MAEFTSHAPGTFCWAELATNDQPGAVAFYRGLFGWQLSEQPVGPDEVYSMFLQRSKEVAAAYTMRPEERQGGAPPHWNLYVSVADVDAMTQRAERLGARIFAPPFDVMDAGRMSVLQDPSGAVIQLWQPKRHIGAKILNEPGALCWCELTTRDPRAAEAFYTALFGWTATRGAASSVVDYTEFSSQGQTSVGMLAMPADMSPHVPSYWMPYFQVENCDASTAKATRLGAVTMGPPRDIPSTGRFSILQDPQGGMFAAFQYTGA